MQKNYQKISENLKFLALDAIETARSGHPGVVLSLCDILSVLIFHAKISPKMHDFLNRDRIVFSGGHASAIIYALYHLYGYDISLQDLARFRQLGSRASGHPERDLSHGIEISTGPLGQGIANAVGMAMASKFYHESLFVPLNHRVFCLCGDGDLQEGISYEACSVAGHLALKNLTIIYDCNEITIEGARSVAFSEDVRGRFLAQGWDVREINGHDFGEISATFEKVNEKPTLIIAKTTIGRGARGIEGTAKAHGTPLGEEIVREMKTAALRNPDENFVVDPEIYEIFAEIVAKNESDFKNFATKNAESLARTKKFLAMTSGKIHFDFVENGTFEINENLVKIPMSARKIGEKIATRTSNGQILNALANLQNFLGGSADLGPSNSTILHGRGDFPSGQNVHFGVREHAMGAISNGIAAFGGLLNFCATFFVFSDYLSHAMRLSAIMRLKILYVFTHDSLGVGEDGVTHQPIEHLSHLRALPDIKVFRPMDANENISCVFTALNSPGPSVFVLSRQDLPVIAPYEKNAAQKGYRKILAQNDAKISLIATGSEVHLAVQAAQILKNDGILAQVFSVPCFELVMENLADFRADLEDTKVLAIEAAAGLEWYMIADDVMNMRTFGMCGKGDEVFLYFGFCAEKIAERAKKVNKK